MKAMEECSRYAAALFESARDRGCLAEVGRDLGRIAELTEQSTEWRQFAGMYMLPSARRMSILTKLFAGKAHGMTFRLMELVERNRHLPLLGRIAAEFQRMSRAREGVARVRIVSARPLGAGLVQALVEKIGRRYGKRVDAKTETDPSLLGGVRVEVGDDVHDYSLAGQLDRVRDALRVA